MNVLDELKQDRFASHLWPFFWQHGEDTKVLEEYLNAMQSQGLSCFCVESRPHPDFLQEGWWKTMDFLVEEARKRGMKFWILDDAKFPTGYANGQVPDSLKKRYLQIHQYDLLSQGFPIEQDLSVPARVMEFIKDPRHRNDQIEKVILARHLTAGVIDWSTLKEITDQVSDRTLRLDLEKGYYSLFVVYQTAAGAEESTRDYLDPMNPKATQVLIDTVYEPHYARYKDEYGKTIQGMFSDEPRFGNVKGPYEVIGVSDMPLPFNEYARQALKQELAPEEWVYLFKGNTDRAKDVRALYMGIVSDLFGRHFSKVLGDWCRAHGILYIGHLIEDNEAHARLGYGPGHYFKAINGFDMAGIDIIGGQVVPGMDFHHDAYMTGGSCGDFFHYTLPRLAASEAKLNPAKKGRVMCEAFGAYGWSEGLKMMKWITDFMISHGINYIVPHAFDPKKFPDWDCPPHFYAHGMNPQFKHFGVWSRYADRLAHLFSDGTHPSRIGVLYHAVGEWSGNKGKDTPILKVLEQNQVDGTLISEDYLKQARVEGDQYIIGNNRFDLLIIPAASYLPAWLNEQIARIPNVVFVDEKPANYLGSGSVVFLDELGKLIRPYQEVVPADQVPSLHVWACQKEDGQVYFLMNTSVIDTIDAAIEVENAEKLASYDAFTNTVKALPRTDDGQILVHLEPFESLILVEDDPDEEPIEAGEKIAVIEKGLVRKKPFNTDPFGPATATDFQDLSLEDPRFSGTLLYQFTLPEDFKSGILHLPQAFETVTVTVDGKEQTRIAPPYYFVLKEIKDPHVQVEVITTLARSQRELFSQFIPSEPIGLCGAPELYSIQSR